MSDGEEAPDRSLFHQISGDPRCEVRASQPEENSLNHHVSLHDEEGSEHQERVDGSRRSPVRDVAHGNTPGEMILSSEGAKSLSAEPFSGAASVSQGGNSSPVSEVGANVAGGESEEYHQVASQEQGSSEEAHAKDDVVLIEEFGVLGQRAVDDVGEIRLVADVNKSNEGQDLIPPIRTIIYEEILEALQKFHEEEPEYSDCEPGIVCSAVDIPR